MHSTYVATNEVALVRGCMVYTERASDTNFHSWQKGRENAFAVRLDQVFGCNQSTYDVWLI